MNVPREIAEPKNRALRRPEKGGWEAVWLSGTENNARRARLKANGCIVGCGGTPKD